MEVREVAKEAVTCGVETPITEVANIMEVERVGSVVVVDRHGQMRGIVTDRDLAVRGLAAGRSGDTPVADVMSADVSFVYEDDDLIRAATQMATQQCRRLPMIDSSGHLVGLVALDDLIQIFSEQIQKLSYTIRSEMKPGRTAA